MAVTYTSKRGPTKGGGLLDIFNISTSAKEYSIDIISAHNEEGHSNSKDVVLDLTYHIDDATWESLLSDYQPEVAPDPGLTEELENENLVKIKDAGDVSEKFLFAYYGGTHDSKRKVTWGVGYISELGARSYGAKKQVSGNIKIASLVPDAVYTLESTALDSSMIAQPSADYATETDVMPPVEFEDAA